MISIEVVSGDLLKRACDLLILKHADGFYGVDEVVARKAGFSGSVSVGNHAFVRGIGTEAQQILLIGVGPLVDFRYEAIREFGVIALKAAREKLPICERICMPMHGIGYGLDEHEAFMSLVSGLLDAIDKGVVPGALKEIEIVEINSVRALRLKHALKSLQGDRKVSARPHGGLLEKSDNFGAVSERKSKVFVAMPFIDKYSDIWEIAIQESCTAAKIVCERIDEAIFTGDILTEIKKRLESCDALIAVLDDANPNVFLEIGYAWALGKPAILLSSNAEKLPFDVRGQRCLVYKNISDLRNKLTAELRAFSAA